MTPTRLTPKQIRTVAFAVDMHLPDDPLPQVIDRAMKHFNARKNPDARPASWDSSDQFLARITVNYLRHICSNYDQYRNDVRHLHPVDRKAIGAVLKGRVLASIAKAYPVLADACRQAAQWDDNKPTHT